MSKFKRVCVVALVGWGAKIRAVSLSGFAGTSRMSYGLGDLFQTLIVNDDVYVELLQELNGEF